MYYLSKEMAKLIDVPRPYKDLPSYLNYKKAGIDILEAHKEEIIRMSAEENAEPMETDNEQSDNVEE